MGQLLMNQMSRHRKLEEYFSPLAEHFTADLKSFFTFRYPVFALFPSFQKSTPTIQLVDLNVNQQDQTLEDGSLLGFNKDIITQSKEHTLYEIKLKEFIQLIPGDYIQQLRTSIEAVNPYAYQRRFANAIKTAYYEFYYYDCFSELFSILDQFTVGEEPDSIFQCVNIQLDKHRDHMNQLSDVVTYVLNENYSDKLEDCRHRNNELPIEVNNIAIHRGLDDQAVSSGEGRQLFVPHARSVSSFRTCDMVAGNVYSSQEEFSQLVNAIQRETNDIGAKLIIIDDEGFGSVKDAAYLNNYNNVIQFVTNVKLVCEQSVVKSQGVAIIQCNNMNGNLFIQLLQIINSLFFNEIAVVKPWFRSLEQEVSYIILKEKKRIDYTRIVPQMQQFNNFMDKLLVALTDCQTIPVNPQESFRYVKTLFNVEKVDKDLREYLHGFNDCIIRVQNGLLLHQIYHFCYSSPQVVELKEEFIELLREFCTLYNLSFAEAQDAIANIDQTQFQTGLLYPSSDKRLAMRNRYLGVVSGIEDVCSDEFLFQDRKRTLNHWSVAEVQIVKEVVSEVEVRAEIERRRAMEAKAAKERGEATFIDAGAAEGVRVAVEKRPRARVQPVQEDPEAVVVKKEPPEDSYMAMMEEQMMAWQPVQQPAEPANEVREGKDAERKRKKLMKFL